MQLEVTAKFKDIKNNNFEFGNIASPYSVSSQKDSN